MSEIALELDSIGIEEEMKQSYLDYAMSVLVGRALPDVTLQEMEDEWQRVKQRSS